MMRMQMQVVAEAEVMGVEEQPPRTIQFRWGLVFPLLGSHSHSASMRQGTGVEQYGEGLLIGSCQNV